MKIQDLLSRFAETTYFIGNDSVLIKSRNSKDIEIEFAPKTQIFAKHETSVYDAEQSLKKWIVAFGWPLQFPMTWRELIDKQIKASKVIKNRKIITCLYSAKSDKMYKGTTVVFENGKLVKGKYTPNFKRNFILTSCPNFNNGDAIDEFVFFAKQSRL